MSDEPTRADDGWKVYQGTYDDSPMILRLDEAYGKETPAAYEYQLGVTVPFNDASPDGLPGQGDMQDLEAIEDAAAIEPRALLVAVITTHGMRELVLYTREPSWVEEWTKVLQGHLANHDVQVMVQHDPRWETYRQLLAASA